MYCCLGYNATGCALVGAAGVLEIGALWFIDCCCEFDAFASPVSASSSNGE